jgi:uncharacterized membrane protein YcjF (UPF0283 family)
MAEEKKEVMTIYDYEDKYVRRENSRAPKAISRILALTIGVIIFTCLFFICTKAYEINQYLGYGVIIAAVIFFVFAFIIPVVKIFSTGYFLTNVSIKNARAAKAHNKALRKQISEKIIDLSSKVDMVKWYDEKTVGELAIAVTSNNEEGIKTKLTLLYKDSVKKSANSLIRKAAMKSAVLTAISQSNAFDVALVSTINLQMIKDIIFLYGFRPSDAKLGRIFTTVIMNSFAAYGLENANIGNTVVKGIGGVTKSIPILGSIIETVIDSTVQGMTNATFTTIIGYQTIKYLEKEYRLQDILDGIELTDENDLKENCEIVEKEIKSSSKPQKNQLAKAQ